MAMVKELVAGLLKIFGAIGMSRGYGTECGSLCGVNNMCIVEKCAHNILDVFDILWSKLFR